MLFRSCVCVCELLPSFVARSRILKHVNLDSKIFNQMTQLPFFLHPTSLDIFKVKLIILCSFFALAPKRPILKPLFFKPGDDAVEFHQLRDDLLLSKFHIFSKTQTDNMAAPFAICLCLAKKEAGFR